MCVCVCDSKSQVAINAITIMKQGGVTARWDWECRDGHSWLGGLSDIGFTPESNCLTRRVLIFFFFLTNCQSWIFGRFHIKTRFLPSLEKSKDIIRLSGYFCVAIASLSTGNVFFLHKPSFLDRAAALICNTYLFLNSEEFSTPELVKEQGPKCGVERIQGT